MPMTNFGTNDPLAVKLWSESTDVEALKHTDIFPLIGDDANTVIHRKTETSTPQGERFSAPQAAIRAELIADDSCCALGMTVHGPAPVLALCRLLVEAGHDPATPLRFGAARSLAFESARSVRPPRFGLAPMVSDLKPSQNAQRPHPWRKPQYACGPAPGRPNRTSEAAVP